MYYPRSNPSHSKNEWPYVSVVIVNFNGRIWLEKFLDSVLLSEYPEHKLEIILVDNGSSDGSIQYAQNKFGKNSKLRIISIEKNVGWARAVNTGFKAARGEILVHISSDIQVTPGWLGEIVKVMGSNSVGIVQCNSISIWDRETPDSGMNFIDKFGFSYGYAPQDEPEQVFFAEALAFGIKRSIIEEVGLFHEFYFMEYDDQDICWRAQLAGYKVFFVPSAIVYHVRGGSVGRTYFESFRTRYLYSRNQIITLIKNYELKNLIETLPVVIGVNITKVIYLFIVNKPEIALAILRGLVSTLSVIKPTLAERERIQQKVRKVSDKEVMGSMVPFNPMLLISFLKSQAKGKRFVLKCTPPTYKELRR